MDTFTDKFDALIRPYMDKIDQVRSILSGGIKGVSFPTVVVVGDQSSGKSTLLEALSLVELPKGSGIGKFNLLNDQHITLTNYY